MQAKAVHLISTEKQEASISDTTAQTANPHPLLAVWQQHVYAEFVTKDVEAALATMSEDARGNWGRGKAAVRAFYANRFLPQVPPDLVATPISQTIGADPLVEEAVHSFTRSLPMAG